MINQYRYSARRVNASSRETVDVSVEVVVVPAVPRIDFALSVVAVAGCWVVAEDEDDCD